MRDEDVYTLIAFERTTMTIVTLGTFSTEKDCNDMLEQLTTTTVAVDRRTVQIGGRTFILRSLKTALFPISADELRQKLIKATTLIDDLFETRQALLVGDMIVVEVRDGHMQARPVAYGERPTHRVIQIGEYGMIHAIRLDDGVQTVTNPPRRPIEEIYVFCDQCSTRHPPPACSR